jgi:hypothetical protein
MVLTDELALKRKDGILMGALVADLWEPGNWRQGAKVGSHV